MKFKFLLFLQFFTLSCIYLYAQKNIKGTVTDASHGELLIGSVVKLNPTEKTAIVNLDGTYIFKNILPGNYELEVNSVNYEAAKQKITLGKVDAKYDFLLTSKVNALTEVSIKANRLTNESKSRGIEKNSNQLVNVLSSSAIQLLPDITVANVMQRMPGVVIDRGTNGEGKHPVIRGMDKRYNTTLINGIKIPSPDNNNRFVPLDLFPSELLDYLEVSKSLTPSMEGDAIGGTVNLVMKDAPKQLLLQVNASTGYSSILSSQPFMAFDKGGINKKSPAELYGQDYQAKGEDFKTDHLNYRKLDAPLNSTFGLTVGQRFGAKKKFGAIISTSYQNMYRGTHSDYFVPNIQPGLENKPVFSNIYLRKYSTQSEQLAVYLNADYKFNKKHKISWFNMYTRSNEMQSRNVIDSVLTSGRKGPGNGNVKISERSTWTIQQIFNSTLKGNHDLANLFKADWATAFSFAKKEVPDQSSYSIQHTVETDANTGVITNSDDLLTTMDRLWRHNTDKDISVYGNLTYTPTIFKRTAEIKLGGLYRYKTRDNYYNSYDLVAAIVNGSTQQYFTNINDATFSFKASDGGKTGEFNANTYSVDEQITAGYLQAKLLLSSKLELLTGVRLEHTRNNYETVQPMSSAGRSGEIYYNDLLPSLQFKYQLNPKQALRLAYYKAIARPGFFEVVPTLESGEYYNEGGNYNLDRTRAHNFDFRYELFPGRSDQLFAGVFYKHINDPIEYGIERISGTSTTQVLKPFNYGDAKNYGLEVAYTKYIGKFGVSANYTYTHSRITTDKLYYYRNESGNISNKTVSQSRPLQGQADHIGNASFIFKDPKLGLDAQIAYVYTGERIVALSPYAGLDYWQKPFTQLDFSLEKTFKKSYSVYTKVSNLTNAKTKVDILQTNSFMSGRDVLPQQTDQDKILVQNTFYKPVFLLGLRYKFI